jgi:hypothetical protein
VHSAPRSSCAARASRTRWRRRRSSAATAMTDAAAATSHGSVVTDRAGAMPKGHPPARR